MISFFSFILFALLCAGTALGLPFLEEKRAIDSDLLARFNLIEQYASAAYCSDNFDSPGDQIECDNGNCPLVQDAIAKSIIEYQSPKSPTDVTGFVALDPHNKLILLSFRGSTSLQNWLTNFDTAAVPTDLCNDCTAHRGFWTSWLDARNRILAAVNATVRSHPDYRIVATGHSLGGAIAPLAAAELRNLGFGSSPPGGKKKGSGVDMYSFGAPRIAGPTLSKYISEQSGGKNYRVTHYNDPVPRLPPLVMGFVHISPEYYIDRGNGERVREGDVRVFEGSVNFRGNGGWFWKDVEAHGWYFNEISNCVSLRRRRRGMGQGEMKVVARF